MEAMQVLHMNKGQGDASYAKNCNVQKQIITVASSIMDEAVADSVRRTLPESMGIADLGCSSGPNTLMVISRIIDTVIATSYEMGSTRVPELRISLNDLPTNDFNNLFVYLPHFCSELKTEKGKIIEVEKNFFIGVCAGSFYGRLFPKKSLHFVHSSSSLHWLSQVPGGLQDKDTGEQLNKGNLYISKTSPGCVVKAYQLQFQRDFFEFMRSRAEETVGGGGMLLSFMGRRSADALGGCKQWELLSQALMIMVPQGLVEEEKIDSLNVPYHAPSPEEVENVIRKEGSFIINHLQAFEIDWYGDSENENSKHDSEGLEKLSKGQRSARSIRAVVEPMLEPHFGKGLVMDELCVRYGDLIDDYLSRTGAKLINLVVSLTRKDY